MRGEILRLIGPAAYASWICKTSIVASLSDRIPLVGDLLVAAQRAYIANSGYDVARQLSFKGQIKVLSVRNAEMGAIEANADWLHAGEVNRRARSWEVNGKRFGKTVPLLMS